MGWMKDETGLEKRPANFVPLTPLSHLIRAAQVFPERTAVVDGAFRATYAEYFTRVTQLASSLSKRGINPGDVVAAVLPNTHPHVEAHFGVPACGAILNSINIRLDTGTISYILDHGEAKIVLVDTQFLGVVEAALKEMEAEDLPLIVEVPDEGARAITPRGGTSPMTSSWPKGTRISPGSCPRMNGSRSRSTTPPAPRGGPRAWSIITGARISSRSEPRSRGV
jgi:acyl-CoA synthetase (AMP-forming)/AMP-acid ligase II